MGASKEKQKRMEAKEANMVHLSKHEIEERKKNKKFKIITAIVIIALVICIAAVVFFKSNAFYRSMTAIEVDGQKYTVAEYNYFCSQQYAAYKSYFGDNIDSFMNSDTMKELTVNKIKETTAYYKEAQKNGFELTEEELTDIDLLMNNYKSYAQLGGMSTDDYLENMYGKGVTESLVREMLEITTLANGYAESQFNAFEYSDEELAENYDPTEDDKIDYRLFTFVASAGDDEDKEAVFAEKRELANKFADEITDVDSFIDLAYEYADENNKALYLKNPDTTFKHTSISSLNEAFKDWLTDDSRKEGDVTVAEDETSCYVVYYVGHDDNEYNTVSARVVPVTMEDVSASDYDTIEEYSDAYDEADKAAHDQAEKMLEEWKNSADATEEEFASLAAMYDNGYSDDGEGLYKHIGKHKFSEAADAWLFDSARKEGDTAVVKSTDGYYIIYFIGVQDMTERQYIADSVLRQEDYEAWKDDVTSSFTVNEKWALRFGK